MAACDETCGSAVAPVVRSLLETVLSEELGTDDTSQMPHLDEATAVLLHKLLHMPTHLSWGMQAMSLTFDTAGLLGGHRFRDKPLAARCCQLRWMKSASVGLLRDFAMFYEKMGSFVFYSIIEEAGEHIPEVSPGRVA